MAKQPLRQSYRYTGPVTPLEHDGDRPRMLFPGTSYSDLPLEQDSVKNMIETGLLIAETGDGQAAEPPIAAAGQASFEPVAPVETTTITGA